MRDGHLRGSLPRTPTARQVDVLAAFVAAGSVADAAARVGVRPSTAKRHLADLRARSGLTTEQLIYRGRAEGWLVVPGLEPLYADSSGSSIGHRLEAHERMASQFRKSPSGALLKSSQVDFMSTKCTKRSLR